MCFTFFRQWNLKIAQYFRYNAFNFVHCEFLTYTIPWASRKWNICKCIFPFHCLYVQKAFRFELVGIFKVFWISTNRINWNHKSGALGNKPLICCKKKDFHTSCGCNSIQTNWVNLLSSISSIAWREMNGTDGNNRKDSLIASSK